MICDVLLETDMFGNCFVNINGFRVLVNKKDFEKLVYEFKLKKAKESLDIKYRK